MSARTQFLIGVVVSAVMLLCLVDAMAQGRELRSWTSNDGRKIEASLLRLDGESVLLRLKNGREAEVPVTRLSEADQTYLKTMSNTGRAIAIKRMPEETKIDQQVPVDGGPRVFNTPHFRFDCDQGVTKGFISEAARVFEGTLTAISSLPLGIDPKPPEGLSRFQTSFLGREAFDEELEKSRPKPTGNVIPPRPIGPGMIKTVVAGVYIPSRKEVLVPFSSLGTKMSGSKVSLRRSSDTTTLIHEITHQVMHDWLAITPVWFGEGLAEYLTAVPYQNGRFEFRNAEKGLKESLEEDRSIAPGSAVPMIHPADLLEMKSSAWRGSLDDYRSAMLLVYYFMHLDQPEKPGAALAGYLHLLENGKSDTENFIADFNQTVADFEVKRKAFNESIDAYNKGVTRYREDVVAFNERVKTYNKQATEGIPEDQRVTVGDEPKPPQPPEKLEVPKILQENQGGGPIDFSVRIHNTARPALVRGRDLDQLAEQISAAYEAIGIKLAMEGRGETYQPYLNPITPPKAPVIGKPKMTLEDAIKNLRPPSQ